MKIDSLHLIASSLLLDIDSADVADTAIVGVHDSTALLVPYKHGFIMFVFLGLNVLHDPEQDKDGVSTANGVLQRVISHELRPSPVTLLFDAPWSV